MRYLAIVGVFISGVSAAASFEERLALADEISETVAGTKYENHLEPYIHRAIASCIPPGSTDEDNLGNFTLVADVQPEGVVTSLEVKPKTKVSNCFSINFASQNIPAPPESLLKNNLMPIAIEMNIVP